MKTLRVALLLVLLVLITVVVTASSTMEKYDDGSDIVRIVTYGGDDGLVAESFTFCKLGDDRGLTTSASQFGSPSVGYPCGQAFDIYTYPVGVFIGGVEVDCGSYLWVIPKLAGQFCSTG